MRRSKYARIVHVEVREIILLEHSYVIVEYRKKEEMRRILAADSVLKYHTRAFAVTSALQE